MPDSESISLLSSARKQYHKELISCGILSIDEAGCVSNADKGNKQSLRYAKGIYDLIISSSDYEEIERLPGQTSGSKFEEVNMRFLNLIIPRLSSFRPGSWHIKKLGNNNKIGITNFEQYSHLADLERLSSDNIELAASLGNGYLVGPDIVIFRDPLSDEELNSESFLVDSQSATKTVLRKVNGGKQILHASVSSKWTLRSDRAQNSRTEALNLIRNRKGHLPHIVDITGEPSLSRIASLALGTGDIDCVYHSFLYELIDVVNSIGTDESKELLKIMVEGKRLKDISDLPLDLVI